jgi:hypothetical protein|tara:strand:+ start:585 stop:794 length:210 start_codon:yes stop_codon:yes gene_type:complete
MNREELEKRKIELWEDYQSAQVEGYFEDYDFVEYMIYMHDLVADELKYATKELREWELKDHPQYRGNKR